MASEIIVVRKAGGWRDRAKGYDVVVDGVVRGEVRAGQSLTVPVAQGHHTIRLEVDWTSSATVTAAVVNKPVIFGCAPGRTAPLAGVEESPDTYVDIWQAASVEEVQHGAPVPLVSKTSRDASRRAASRSGSPLGSLTLPVAVLVWVLGLVVFGAGLLAGSGGWQNVVKTVGLGVFVISSWTVVIRRGWPKRRKR